MEDQFAEPKKELLSFPGKIHLITKDHELSHAVEQLQNASELGFDTETRPSFVKGQVFKVALVQLATDTDAYLIRMHSITDYKGLTRIFEDKNTIKTGVAIRDDLKSLQKIFKFLPQNFIELQDVAKAKALKNFGLKGMTEEVLLGTITKGPKTTNWEAHQLTERQLMYAATDAWIGLKLYQKLKS